MQIIWTDYLVYRAEMRGFDLVVLERILLTSTERYIDVETRRLVVVGRAGRQLVAVPVDEDDGVVTPVTVHSVTRQQIRLRVRTGRFLHE